ncbi:GNAT family N-acetyltransferase [Lacticaseibacillus saniviri]|uniref:Uncharacterized protein n=1 Tax=Lacticaseibacillus saniviri JCM 17471 = DSM 24301 TaxID=1293598 RepID=A0A0R2MXC1_9LACO|nr:GNAT family N-acetyltransferase [Lacticaseibacillus saniviri]KRO18057.1 hypothetical protein IV56_GL001854 [Lacticaseibacillus saniviri JCM 17471 = DSM 24301]MCG4282313.1 N-acetyltransferase [Lacticaseibacillus saniviri]
MEFLSEPGRFYLENPEHQLLAEITFQSIADDTAYSIDHTFVDESLRGQGIAAQLVDAVVQKARAEHKMIQPLCTYAVHSFETHPEYADIWRKGSGLS